MRALHIFLFLMGLCLAGRAQYYVLNVSGVVYADDKVVQKKDKISENAKLRFGAATAFAYVISPGKGYYVLGVKDKSKTAKGEFIVALKDALLPPNEYYAAATRTNGGHESQVFEDQYDLKAFFREQLFFTGTAKFRVTAGRFTLDADRFFMVRHYLDDGWIGKRLPHVGQEFQLDKQVFELQGNTYEESSVHYSELWYINQTTGEEQYLSRFQVRFYDPEVIEAELLEIYQATGKMSAARFLIEHAIPYLGLQYGKTQPDSIARMVESIQKKM